MKKKFLVFFTITVALIATVLGMYFRFISPNYYMVFIESFDHGVITIDSSETVGTDTKYKIKCKKGAEITLNINPERTDSAYYNLNKLYVNGNDVTKQVNMLQYKTTVESKLTVVASFKKGKRPENYKPEQSAVKIEKPDIITPVGDGYLGSFAAYDIKDPSIIYDKNSGYYYCFGSDNVVIKSTDLVNWGGRTTYFPHNENSTSNAVMTFSAFDSVNEWAKQHGYSDDEVYSDSNQDRTPLAPDIVKVGDTYYLYFSLSKTAEANESAIFCVKTDDLEKAIRDKDWEDVGLVINSCGRHAGTQITTDENGKEKKKNVTAAYDDANAVHPCVVYTQDGLYLAYGGYYGRGNIQGAIYLLELDKKTGLLKAGSTVNAQGPTISTLHGGKGMTAGTLIANPGRIPALSKKDGSLVSGCDIAYHGDTGYYYMLLTYGTQSSNYNIRLARSKNIAGPYLDISGSNMAEFENGIGKSQYSKGTVLMGGYNFLQSSAGSVLYSNIGRASIGSPCMIQIGSKWYIASQSQIYYKVNADITTGAAQADELAMDINADPSLEIREITWSKDGWPMAQPEVYAGTAANKSVKMADLYGNWDIVIFDRYGNADDYKAVERSTSQVLTLHEGAVISRNDIASKKALNTAGVLTKAKGYYTVTIDSMEYRIYPSATWDWELSEGSIVFTGYGADGSTIWGKKNMSASLGIYTDAFYYVLKLSDSETQAKYNNQIKKISSNPSQYDIDAMTGEMIDLLLKVEK